MTKRECKDNTHGDGHPKHRIGAGHYAYVIKDEAGERHAGELKTEDDQ